MPAPLSLIAPTVPTRLVKNTGEIASTVIGWEATDPPNPVTCQGVVLRGDFIGVVYPDGTLEKWDGSTFRSIKEWRRLLNASV